MPYKITFAEEDELKFLTDEMCGRITRWLRLLGYDTKYAKDYEPLHGISLKDSKIIDICFKEHRILISRDREMIKTMKLQFFKIINPKVEKKDKIIPPCLFINRPIQSGNNQLVQDMVQIRNKFRIRLNYDSNMARCPQCNSKMLEIGRKEKYKEIIPKKVYEYHDKFWVCENKDCKKVYWIGTHFKRILEKLDVIKKTMPFKPRTNKKILI
ncbi:MAG: Mut7-C RNAse domain-containing protein [Promethearchaeota archaeon]